MNTIQPALGALRTWWRSYWVGDGFWLSYGVCRIALGLLLLSTFWQSGPADVDYRTWLPAHNPADYRPIGILYLFGTQCPSPELFVACQSILKVSIWCVIFGICSRLSFLITTVGMLVLTAVAWAYAAEWCIGYPAILLPALAMLLGPPSPLSVDALVRRYATRREEVEPAVRQQARLPVLLGQFAVALMFADAGLHKMYLGNGELFAWVYSDTLRNIVISQWWGCNAELPPWLDFVVTHAWAYKGMALANVLTQCAPLVACFLVRRPLLRAMVGSTFLLEVIGLKLVMCMPVLQWCGLLVFFIDWDRLAGLVRVPGGVVGQAGNLALGRLGTLLSWCQNAWALFFLGFYLYVGLHHTKQRRYTYPFMSFPMFSGVVAEQPYGEHRRYQMLLSRWDMDVEPPLSEAQIGELRIGYRWLAWSAGDNVAFAVNAVKEQFENSNYKVRRITLERAVYVLPPYPETRVQLFASAPVCDIQGNRRRTVLVHSGNFNNALGPCVLRLQAEGFAQPHFRLEYFTHDPKIVHPLTGEWRDGIFHFARPTDTEMCILVRVRDEDEARESTFFGTVLPEIGESK